MRSWEQTGPRGKRGGWPLLGAHSSPTAKGEAAEHADSEPDTGWVCGGNADVLFASLPLSLRDRDLRAEPKGGQGARGGQEEEQNSHPMGGSVPVTGRGALAHVGPPVMWGQGTDLLGQASAR